jgi:hypothetical protein
VLCAAAERRHTAATVNLPQRETARNWKFHCDKFKIYQTIV